MPVKLSTPATPITEFDDSVSVLPLATATLKRSCPPEKVEASLKVTVPLEAVNLPVPPKDELIVMLLEVEAVPEMARPENVATPVFAMLLSAPASVIIPPFDMSDLLEFTARLPLTVKDAEVVTVPAIVRLLNSVEPGEVDIVLLEPDIVTVLVLPAKVPLDVQLPATVCEALPPLKVALASIITSPPTVMLAPAVELAEPVLVKLPAMLIAVEGSVLVFELDSVR